jgi:hypothetical protein
MKHSNSLRAFVLRSLAVVAAAAALTACPCEGDDAVACGENCCVAGTQCCNSLAGICVAEGDVCIQSSP